MDELVFQSDIMNWDPSYSCKIAHSNTTANIKFFKQPRWLPQVQNYLSHDTIHVSSIFYTGD